MRRLSFLIFIFSVVGLAQSPHGTNLKADCSECHQSTTWKLSPSTMTFNHATTPFPLSGQHTKVSCRQCHSTLVFEKAKTDCQSCHRDVHANSVGLECNRCHTPQSWVVSNPNKLHQASRFPLLGTHAKADCKQCHSGYQTLNFKVMDVSCYGCHATDFMNAKNPNHLTAGFSKECQTCHSSNSVSWRNAQFAHDFFPLLGMHKIENCFSCHAQGSFQGLNSQCYGCHQKNYTAAANPNHTATGLGTECKTCHTINGWRPAIFDHSATGFVLTGMHVSADCGKCHVGGNRHPSQVCVDCHRTDYNNTTNPKHSTANIPTTCNTCHSTSGWRPAQLDHDGPYFPIFSGKHKNTWNDCNVCHTNSSNYKVFSCIGCHEHNQASMQNEHAQVNGYVYESNACLACHPRGTKSGAFNHQTSPFPLTGNHAAAQCSSCHTNGYTAKPASDCKTCHEDKRQQAQNPNHMNASFPVNCQTCHSTSVWKPSGFDHQLNTQFALDGKHLTATCNSCHQTQFTGASKVCKDCHITDFQQSANPNHTLANFTQPCVQCHTSSGWKPATYDHSTTGYSLVGKHGQTSCNKCHTTQYAGTARDCYGCHQTTFTNAVNPRHYSPGFSTVCTTCHKSTIISWTGVTFTGHDAAYFPVYSGKHNGTWAACNTCHQTASNYKTFSCVSCHEHNKAEMDSKHQGRNGYVYQSDQCYRCHPRGNNQGFDHASSAFPLTGAHLTTDCNLCHTSTATPPKECKACHEQRRQQAVNPNHMVANFPVLCQNCHNTTLWKPSSFNHQTNTQFILDGKHLTATCNSCHQTQFAGVSKLCKDCHEQRRQQATNPNHMNTTFPTACQNCHNTNIWKPSSFDHQTNTQFILDGKHLTATCNSCHQTQFAGVSKLCKDCHEQRRQQATNPNHMNTTFPTACQNCHNTNIWKPSSFDHQINTQYVLTGKHLTATCNSCHQTLFAGASKICKDCHITDYQQSTNPNHQLANFTQPCTECHTTAGWKPSSYNHSTTGYALIGKHTLAACNKCHQTQYANTPQDCFSCHQATFNNAVNPRHYTPGFSQVCTTCHASSISGWTGVTFTGHDAPYFPVYSGKHRNTWTNCTQCHETASNYKLFSCITCHEHNKTLMDTKHQGRAGYSYVSSECFRCHPRGSGLETNAHLTSIMPLTGAHNAVSCDNCHKRGEVKTAAQCSSCHEKDRTAAQSVNHNALGLSGDCAACHTTNPGWRPSTYAHSSFPLSARHKGFECADCHTNNFQNAQCVSCHAEQFRTGHRNRGPSLCFQCHSTTQFGIGPKLQRKEIRD